MKQRTILILLALAAMLALSVGLSMAQGPRPTLPTDQFDGGIQALVGREFTYQGHLKKGGSPVNATCTMAFHLYDDATAGNLWGAITTTVAIADGLFTVPLDFGPYAFPGSARWLEIAVACPGDPGFSTLTPRQALTAVPYALSLRPGAEIIEAVHSGAILLARNTVTGTVSGGLSGISDSTLGYGVHGLATAGSGATSGVYGESESAQGYGVYGVSDHVGVYGETSAAGGNGVFGYSRATSSETYGVYGRTDSIQGMGVFGRAAATTGYAYGVYGRSDSTQGRGVRGVATASSGYVVGVEGESASTDGYGVYGLATATSGSAVGVVGHSLSTAGYGVWAWASAPTGTTYGVYGRASSSSGTGVYGWAMSTTGTNYGVYGRSESTGGYGVYGVGGNGVRGEGTAVGVYGIGPTGLVGDSSTPNGAGVMARNFATTGSSTYGIYGRSDSATGWCGYFTTVAGNGVYITTPAGKTGLNVVGGTKNAVVRTRNGSRLLYSEESAEVWFTDYGFGRLQDGVAIVPIDPLFAQTVNLEEPYLVFLTPQGDCGLYVAEKTRTSFTVRALDGRACNIAFDYRIVAKRLGYEDTRLAPAPWADDDPNLYPERAPAER